MRYRWIQNEVVDAVLTMIRNPHDKNHCQNFQSRALSDFGNKRYTESEHSSIWSLYYTCASLPEILWPHRPRAVNEQISVGSSQLFWDEAFVVLTDPVPSTNYHNMQSIVWLWEQKTHTLFIWLFAYWSLYIWASKPFQQVFYGRAIRPHREAMGVWSYRIRCLLISKLLDFQ